MWRDPPSVPQRLLGHIPFHCFLHRLSCYFLTKAGWAPSPGWGRYRNRHLEPTRSVKECQTQVIGQRIAIEWFWHVFLVCGKCFCNQHYRYPTYDKNLLDSNTEGCGENLLFYPPGASLVGEESTWNTQRLWIYVSCTLWGQD